MTTITITKKETSNPYLNEPERPIYAVFRLMRQLSNDITNAGPLTQDQSQMAEAVAYYADITYDTLMDGLTEIGKLMAQSYSESEKIALSLGRLILHLSFEAQFMQEAYADYRDASLQTCR